MPARSRQPQALRVSSKHAVGVGLHLCRDLDGFHLPPLRHQHLRQADHRWWVSRTIHANFVVDALEQALHDRRAVHRGDLIHHSDRGSPYVSIEYTERIAATGIEASVNRVGNSYESALAETINCIFKVELAHRRGRGATSKALNTPRWNGSTGSTVGDCSNSSETSRLPKPKNIDMAACLKNQYLRQTQRGSIRCTASSATG